ncbi:MAG: radical SAM protein [Desulfarculus sp.]|nr:radical SAM protein [Desulfarculus sp.]
MSPAQSAEQAVFGPVPSRRLGLSLGVDLLWPKTCTLDCLYCELGLTTRLTRERGRFRDAGQVLAQVEGRLAELASPPDFITLAGSGEPSLHLDLGLVLSRLRDLSPARLAVLTNATLVGDAQVRDELCLADLLVPSLDAVSPEVFRRLNRPVPGLKVDDMIEGLKALRRQFSGQMWLEILLVAGINDSPRELDRLMAAVRAIAPDKVQINTVVRPPAVAGIRPVEHGRLKEIAAGFPVPAEVIAPPRGQALGGRGALADQVVEMTRRRPCTRGDIAAMGGLNPQEAQRLLEDLLSQGRLRAEPYGEEVFYRGL